MVTSKLTAILYSAVKILTIPRTLGVVTTGRPGTFVSLSAKLKTVTPRSATIPRQVVGEKHRCFWLKSYSYYTFKSAERFVGAKETYIGLNT